MVEIQDKDRYFRLIKDFEYIPYPQTFAWHQFNTIYKPDSTHFYIDSEESPSIALFGHEKRFLGFKMLLIDGECFNNLQVEAKKLTAFFDKIKETGFDIIEIDSYLTYNPQYEIGIRRSGFLRPVGLFSSSFSMLVDLKSARNYDKNWKQNLKKAEKFNLLFENSETISSEQIHQFYSLYQEMLLRKKISDSTLINQFLELTNQKEFRFCSVRNQNNDMICAIIYYISQNQAVDLYRVTTLEARTNGASYFIYDHLFSILAEIGVQHYDMGRLTPSTHSKDSVYTFKSGAGGEYTIYNGEWAWYKYAILRPLMYFVKRFLMNRIEV